MKLSTKKTLFLIGGILIVLGIISNIILIISLLVYPEFLIELTQYIEYYVLGQVTGRLYNATIILITLYFIITLLFSIIGSVVFFLKSKYTKEQFDSKKTSNLVWSIFILVFLNLISGILGIIASLTETAKEDVQNVSVSNEEEKPNQTELQMQIGNLKKLKENGTITEEEYNKLFENLIK